MNYSIPQQKFKKIIFKYLDNKFDSFSKLYNQKFPAGVFYVLDDQIMAEVIQQQNAVVLNYDLWSNVFTLFDFRKTSEFQNVLSEWGDERFGLQNSLIDFHDFGKIHEEL